MMRLLTTACAAALLALPLSAQELSRDQIKALVLETIRENPSIVMEAIEIIQAEEEAAKAEAAQAAVSANRDVLLNDPNAIVLGNPDGDVTVVEFFDYNCGYCRRVFPSVKALMEADPNLRVVMREFPILGEESVYAARAALAVRKQGKYAEFHDALMANRGRANEATVKSVAKSLGLDMAQLEADMNGPEIQAHIQLSGQLAQSLGVNGTPAFVFGNVVVPGAIDLDQMKSLVSEARDAG